MKNMKKLILALMVTISALMMSSCIYVVADGDYTTPGYGRVIIDNDGPSNCYVDSFYYRENGSSQWIECTNGCYDDISKQYKVSLEEGRYEMKIYVAFKKYGNVEDVYEYEAFGKINVNDCGYVYMTFDGNSFYRD